MKLEALWLVGRGLILAILVAPSLIAAQQKQADPSRVELRRHHVGAQIGPFNPSTDAIGLANLDLSIDGTALLGILSYRYSLNPFVDLDFELRHWIGRWPRSGSDRVKVAAGFIGPGIRIYGADRTSGTRVFPYIQANIYYAQEQVSRLETLSEHGVGFGLSGGVDLAISRRISIPIEATHVRSRGILDDLSGFGVSVGVNVSF